ncbi:MAG TPA: ferritin-like domain-containing protein [Polyangiaceae bacterium]|nr:ferritin-like domain-containing protein [Polyangiaceae bacterium]
MRTHFKLDPLLSALLASVALSPAVGCGGSSEGKPDGAGGSNSVTLGECDNPIATDASGWVSCNGRFSHRETAGTCDPFVPRTDDYLGCNDADCASLPYGHCWSSLSAGLPSTAHCIPGCVSDADCESAEICLCEDPVGRCIPALDCAVDADCGSNAFCSTYVGPPEPACSFYVDGAACQKQSDACVGNECNCAMVAGERACVDGLGGCGRPFLVAGVERTACPEPRGDWARLTQRPERLDELAPSVRARLAEHWTRAGLLEHASIAAFARFSLELLALGAPAALVADSTHAMADETRHAELCFALASAYAGSPVGPGPLAVGDCLSTTTLESVLRTALLEGCIGETVAAAEARELCQSVQDPVLRDALELIADDEARHAELAFRFARWALERGGADLTTLVQSVLERERERARFDSGKATTSEDESAGLALGLPTATFRAALKRDVLERVVMPCFAALVLDTKRTRLAPPSPVADTSLSSFA